MIDTSVEGEVDSVTGAATWLRGTLKAGLMGAADDCARGRRIAGREWEGDDQNAYSEYARSVMTMTDDHAARVGRAAAAFESYGARLSAMKTAMAGIRSRAVGGGLNVSGDHIIEPPVVAATVVEVGSPEEAAHKKAVAEVELYNTLSGDTTTAWINFDQWIQANLVPDVADAEDDSPVDKVMSEVNGQFPNFAAGVGAGLSGKGLQKRSEKYRDEAREFRRRSRVSGDPRVRGQVDTPRGSSTLDDLLAKVKWLGKAGRLLGGPVGVGVDIFFGIKDARESGDWKRAAITTGTSLAVAGGVALYVATAPVSVPVTLVVIGGGLLAAGASAGVGVVYDNWDDITDWTGDRWDDAKDLPGDAWDGAKDFAGGAKDKAGDAWDKVTPW
jgi:hypothetical protein